LRRWRNVGTVVFRPVPNAVFVVGAWLLLCAVFLVEEKREFRPTFHWNWVRRSSCATPMTCRVARAIHLLQAVHVCQEAALWRDRVLARVLQLPRSRLIGDVHGHASIRAPKGASEAGRNDLAPLPSRRFDKVTVRLPVETIKQMNRMIASRGVGWWAKLVVIGLGLPVHTG
jgi:hypothetical protein